MCTKSPNELQRILSTTLSVQWWVFSEFVCFLSISREKPSQREMEFLRLLLYLSLSETLLFGICGVEASCSADACYCKCDTFANRGSLIMITWHSYSLLRHVFKIFTVEFNSKERSPESRFCIAQPKHTSVASRDVSVLPPKELRRKL